MIESRRTLSSSFWCSSVIGRSWSWNPFYNVLRGFGMASVNTYMEDGHKVHVFITAKSGLYTKVNPI
jgi:hypothetical protein